MNVFTLVYRQLRDSNSQWHKKKSSKKCQLGEVPVGGQGPDGGQNLTLGRTIFLKFCRR